MLHRKTRSVEPPIATIQYRGGLRRAKRGRSVGYWGRGGNSGEAGPRCRGPSVESPGIRGSN